MTFSFLDIILFLGVSQGIFLATTLRLVQQRNKAANRVLSLAIAIAVIMLIGRVLAYRVTGNWVVQVAVVVDTTIFLFGPLIYTYARRLAFNEDPLFKLSFWHYALAILHGLYALGFVVTPLSFLKIYQESGWLHAIGFVVETLGIISLVIYTVKCLLLVFLHKKEIKKELSYDLNVNRYLLMIVLALSLSAILWLISYFLGYFLRVYSPYINYSTLWVSISLFIYVVGYFSLRQPEIFRVPFVPKRTVERPRLKPDEIEMLQKRLQHHVREGHVFLKPDLTLKALASMMDTSGNNLSWLLNQVYQKSFYDYINELRVKEVIRKINLEAHHTHTFLAIALDAGFNAKSTFNKAFKNFTGLTPTQYIKEKNVA